MAVTKAMDDETMNEREIERLLRTAAALPAAAALAAETETAMARTWAALRKARPTSGVAEAPWGGVAAAFTTVAAPWGTIHLAVSGEGLVSLELASEAAEFVDHLALRLHGSVVPAEDSRVPAEWRRRISDIAGQLREYFVGRLDRFEVPVDLAGISDWDRRVLAGAARLSFGETTSYGELARRIGKPGAARAVGSALGRNPVPIVIPCHRILAADGSLGGYGGANPGDRQAMLAVKRRLLTIEGSWRAA